MDWLALALTWILERISAALTWIGELFEVVFESAWLLLLDVVSWVFDEALGIALTVLESLDFSSPLDAAALWAGLPSQVLEWSAAIGLGPALGIVAWAIGIRFVLQLIPFVRLGS
jgi:hypothetical protein